MVSQFLFRNFQNTEEFSFNACQKTIDFFGYAGTETGVLQLQELGQASQGIFPFCQIQIFLATMPAMISGTNVDTADFLTQDLQIATALLFVVLEFQHIRYLFVESFCIVHLIVQTKLRTAPVQFDHKLVSV